MPHPVLYEHVVDFRGDTYRNIVSLKVSEDLFDDISDGDEVAEAVAICAEMNSKRSMPPSDDVTSRAMAYNEAVAYPFDEHDPPLYSRYSDGSFPAWYGSVAWETTVHETAYHYLKSEMAREGASDIQWRERKVYLVNCRGILIDLRGKVEDFPDIVANDHSFCRMIGSRCHEEGIPGILAPSARHQGGVNVNIFRREALSNVRVAFYLEYALNLPERTVSVLRSPEDPPLILHFDL